MKEKTFVFIKPDHVDLANKILHELDTYGDRIQTVKIDYVPKEIIENHYAPHKGKFFFDYMVDYFVNKPLVIAIYEGENIIEKLIEVIGPTDPSKASSKTIRGKYSKDSLETAIVEKRTVKNVIHRSNSIKEFKREIEVWKNYIY